MNMMTYIGFLLFFNYKINKYIYNAFECHHVLILRIPSGKTSIAIKIVANGHTYEIFNMLDEIV
jgi:hypothetical protein